MKFRLSLLCIFLAGSFFTSCQRFDQTQEEQVALDLTEALIQDKDYQENVAIHQQIRELVISRKDWKESQEYKDLLKSSANAMTTVIKKHQGTFSLIDKERMLKVFADATKAISPDGKEKFMKLARERIKQTEESN